MGDEAWEHGNVMLGTLVDWALDGTPDLLNPTMTQDEAYAECVRLVGDTSYT